MSILIKGMKMPIEQALRIILKNGQLFVDNGSCFAEYEAVEVPTPHGPLIDASAKIEVEMYDEEWSVKTMMVSDLLTSAAEMPPTIIEAEAEEEHGEGYNQGQS